MSSSVAAGPVAHLVVEVVRVVVDVVLHPHWRGRRQRDLLGRPALSRSFHLLKLGMINAGFPEKRATLSIFKKKQQIRNNY